MLHCITFVYAFCQNYGNSFGTSDMTFCKTFIPTWHDLAVFQCLPFLHWARMFLIRSMILIHLIICGITMTCEKGRFCPDGAGAENFLADFGAANAVLIIIARPLLLLLNI